VIAVCAYDMSVRLCNVFADGCAYMCVCVCVVVGMYECVDTLFHFQMPVCGCSYRRYVCACICL
jgi:hypothetical protein